MARDSGVAVVGFVKAVLSGDYNNDGRPDLFVSVQGGDPLLFRNDGPSSDTSRWRFTDSKEAGIPGPMNSFGAFFFDFDNDGWLDLFVVGWGRTARQLGLSRLIGWNATARRGAATPTPRAFGLLERPRGPLDLASNRSR